jgi:hypothetical protein
MSTIDDEIRIRAAIALRNHQVPLINNAIASVRHAMALGKVQLDEGQHEALYETGALPLNLEAIVDLLASGKKPRLINVEGATRKAMRYLEQYDEDD